MVVVLFVVVVYGVCDVVVVVILKSLSQLQRCHFQYDIENEPTVDGDPRIMTFYQPCT